ncbi:protein kinase subdomain-containing protein [Nannizzia gypsea CBS 118893]|uniref:Protein kinase subdomain-containing protein n=1 Tax=Arthroderma gypseum (strain ATCC MYA-4604 / CBS 118893) TaxID=535722 RepID=E5QZ76_ARTGP|nr:protein kinase subdomain-containing protein [Nannizzia gypsea CBS 118893]EFQ97308.1 protein kinase subdomain-containing protein [Nannizzia gypsea CBS 118893]
MSSSHRTPVLRKSCHFCRSRKIRCSGQSICEACQERNIDCVYDLEAAKGRPKRKHIESRDPKLASDRGQAGKGTGSHDGNGKSTGQWDPTLQGPLMGDDLTAMFHECFISKVGMRATIFQGAIAAGHERLKQTGSHASPQEVPQRISYDGLMSSMTREIVEMISLRFGDLNCEVEDSFPRRYCITSLARDTTHEMFDNTIPRKNPLKSYSSHRILQLIDLWFSVHPLSSLISKTLLLSSLKNSTYDEALLATILSDACLVHENGQNYDTEGQLLFDFATYQIQNRSVLNRDIASSQALILMAWREICMGNARRGSCLTAYACRIVSELHRGLNQGVSANGTKLNGIDVRYVDGELIRNIYWVCWSTTVWSLMQIDQPYNLLLPEQTPSQFPFVDESTSMTISLDLASDNVSTLRAQSRALQELWPLSQVASTAAHIYALCPNPDLKDTLETVEWQARHIHQLRRLLSFQLELPTLCGKIRHILLEAIRQVELEVTPGSTQAVVLIAYHTMIVHMLFPQRQTSDSVIIMTPERINEFCQSANALVAISHSVISPQTTTLLPGPGLKTKNVSDIFALGLDACSRALAYIHSRANCGRDEYQAIMSKNRQLLHLAQQLHDISRGELSRASATMRTIKKRLKFAKVVFSSISESTPPLVHGDPSPIAQFRSRIQNLSHSSNTSVSGGLSQPGSPIPDDASYLSSIPNQLSLDMFLGSDTSPVSSQDGFDTLHMHSASSSLAPLDHSGMTSPFTPSGMSPLQPPRKIRRTVSPPSFESHGKANMFELSEPIMSSKPEHIPRSSGSPSLNSGSMFRNGGGMGLMGLDMTPNDGHKKFLGEPMNFSQQLFMSSENDPDFGSGPLLFGNPLDTNNHGDFNAMPDLTCIEGENGFMPLDLGYLG